MASNPRSGRELILRGDELLEVGRFDEARDLYRECVHATELVGDLNPKQSVELALTEAIGHERLALVNIWTGDPRSALHEFAQSESAFDLSLTHISQIGSDEAELVQEITAEAPIRWQQVLSVSDPVEVVATVDLAFATRTCRHGCLTRSGLCRGHPPDPCI